MTTWREELLLVIKTQAERDAEEAERKRKRLEQALVVAKEAMELARTSLTFADEQIRGKGQPCSLSDSGEELTLTLHELRLLVSLASATAVLSVTYNDGRAREFDFGEDRHTAPRDVEDYVGRRTVELARAAQKAQPW